jgi:peptidoglycan/LPS O-acetylase OafA/YrhL
MHFLLSFYFGVGAYVLKAHLPLSLPGVAALALGAFAAQDTPIREFVEMLAVAYGALWLAFGPNLAQNCVNKIGDYSFGLYILAFPIQQTIRFIFPDISALDLFLWATLATVPLAVASWHFVERPCLNWRASLVERTRKRVQTIALAAAKP